MSREWSGPDPSTSRRVGRDDLVAHLRGGFKEPDGWLLGLEYEMLGTRLDGTALPYYGPGGVESVLEGLEETYGIEGHREEGHLVGLDGVDGAGVSLEPGGQIELISAPRRTLAELDEDLCTCLEGLMAASPTEARWLGVGLQPVSPLESMQWISRERYRIMARHLGARGDLAHLMMTQTAGVQVNLDFADDEDAATKLRTAMGVTSLTTAAWANSPLYEGRATGWASRRAHIWTRTDPERCGLVRGALEGDGMGPEEWTEWALDVPTMFIVREGRYLSLDGRPFRRYLEEGFEEHRAILADWKLHLTTLFPEVRLKSYLEVRGMDTVPRELGLAAAALWKGILYSGRACEDAWRLVEDLSWSERLALGEEAARHGTRGELRGRPLLDWVRDLVAIARSGLEDPARATPVADEARYLEPLEERLEEGGSPAFALLERWESEWKRDPTRLVDATAMRRCPAPTPASGP